MRLKLLTFALALAASPLAGHGKDLLDVYREAQANDPTLSQSDAARLAASEDVRQKRALLLPQVNGTASLNQLSGRRLLSDSSHARSQSLSVGVRQSVFDPGKWATLSSARSQMNARDATYQAALQDLYVRTATAYFGVLTGADQLTFAKANEEALREACEQADRRFHAGLSTITDVYRVRSKYEQSKADAIQAETKLNDAKEALTQITGKPVDDLKTLREDLPMEPPTPADPNVWVQHALKHNLAIAAQRFKVEAAEHRIRSAKAGHLLHASASVTHGKSSATASSFNSTGVGAAGSSATRTSLTLNLPIFSGGRIQSQVRQSIYNRDSARHTLDIQRRQLTRDTLNFYRTSIAGISQVKAARASLDSGRKALDATRAGFGIGTQTVVNVLNAIQTLARAQSVYSQARHRFVLNKLQLKQIAGTVTMQDIEEINALLQ